MARRTASLRSSTMSPPFVDRWHSGLRSAKSTRPYAHPMSDFAEVADRIWVARYDWFDVNVGLVAGAAGLVVVDTNATTALGRDALDAVRRISDAPIVA